MDKYMSWTEEEYAAFLAKSGQPKPKQPKYHNVKTTVDGITFDSKRESRRWSELQLLIRSGEIVSVARQVPFQLTPSIKYIADFIILKKDGTYTVEDSKGVRTKEYSLKKRMMRDILGIEIQEV